MESNKKFKIKDLFSEIDSIHDKNLNFINKLSAEIQKGVQISKEDAEKLDALILEISEKYDEINLFRSMTKRSKSDSEFSIEKKRTEIRKYIRILVFLQTMAGRI